MKTLVYGMLLLFASIMLSAVVIWAGLKFARWIRLKLTDIKELRVRWKNNTPVEVGLFCDVYADVFNVMVRKRRWRLFKDSGWKYVNQYVKGDPILDVDHIDDPDDAWRRITYKVGLNQFREQEILDSLIKTYGDLDAYFFLRVDQYQKDKKSYEPAIIHQPALD